MPDLAEAYIVVMPVVKLSRAWTFMDRHCLGFLNRAAVFQVSRDPGRLHRVIADCGWQAGGFGATLQQIAGR